MIKIADPQWTRKIKPGRIIDPLQLRTIRNRILTDLLFGILSIQITQRNRYYSFYSWIFAKLGEIPPKTIVLLEKIFLLANLSHEYYEKIKETKGLVGASRLTENADNKGLIANLYNPSVTEYSIASTHFKIHENDGCGFFQYYKSGMDRLLLLNKRILSSLGKELAEAFDNKIKLDFNQVIKACEEATVSEELLRNFGENSSYRFLYENKVIKEKEILRKIFFNLIDYSNLDYETLKFVDLEDVSLTFDLTPYLSTSDDARLYQIIEAKLFEIPDYLPRYVKGGFGEKMKTSLTLFLHIIKKLNEAMKIKQDDFFDVYTESELKIFGSIKELWKLFGFHDYLIIACEALLFGILRVLEDKKEGIAVEKILDMIIKSSEFSVTINTLLNGIKLNKKKRVRNFQTIVFDTLYYEETILCDLDPEVKFKTGPRLLYGKVLNQIQNKNHSKLPELNSEINELAISLFLLKQVRRRSLDPLTLASSLFATSAILLCLLKIRYDLYYTQDIYAKYWNWLSQIEGGYLGPIQIINFLNNQEKSIEIGELIKKFVVKFVVEQHKKVLFERLSVSRIPWLFSLDFEGKLHFQNIWKPEFLYTTKFDRMIDIFYDLGLVKDLNYKFPQLSSEGETWLKQVLSRVG
ncbi:MAG: hypothetical protein HWN66_20620 [Candidatus Helarchaeota archaeon]|nr:hypothetical protein [Candidatus Helarchaeota archaeon]